MPKAQEKQQTIDEVLGSLNPYQKTTIENLRQLIKTQAPQAIEMVKQGKIVYKLQGTDFAWINRYKQHVDLEFAMGSRLASDLLKRRGVAEQNRHTRHVEVSSFILAKSELERLVREAATITLEHVATR